MRVYNTTARIVQNVRPQQILNPIMYVFKSRGLHCFGHFGKYKSFGKFNGALFKPSLNSILNRTDSKRKKKKKYCYLTSLNIF